MHIMLAKEITHYYLIIILCEYVHVVNIYIKVTDNPFYVYMLYFPSTTEHKCGPSAATGPDCGKYSVCT